MRGPFSSPDLGCYPLKVGELRKGCGANLIDTCSQVARQCLARRNLVRSAR